jgi:Tol biopolymer transport system component
MRSLILCAIVALSASQPPAGTPVLFAPGVVSGVENAGSPTFMPDGNTMYFTRNDAHRSVILESQRVGGAWSTPKAAPFSGGQWSDQQPALAPDGSFLVFVSVREHVANLWRVDRQGTGWSPPSRLPVAVNIGPSIWRPSVARDGSTYFFVIGKDEKGRTMRLYRSPCDHGHYLPAVPLPFSDGAKQDVDPEIAPDESFIVFASAGRSSADDAHEHLFVAHRRGADWGPVTPLRYVGSDTSTDDNEPRLAPDRLTLYFSSSRSNGNANVMSLPTGKWLVD